MPSKKGTSNVTSNKVVSNEMMMEMPKGTSGNMMMPKSQKMADMPKVAKQVKKGKK